MSEEIKKNEVAATPAAKPATPAAPAAKKARVWFKDPKTGKVTEGK
jgi:hypothetical protein